MGNAIGKLRLVGPLVLVLALGACSASFRSHGYVPPSDQLEEIVVGVDTRDSVAETIGSPTSSSLVNDTGYYYVRQRVRSFAFTAPTVVDREVLAITFDQQGVVSNIERFGLEDGRVVTLERRVTESSVVDRTFLRQLLGSLGRIRPSGF
ncbi:outer membrane protein assembly factor BamE [Aliishimia ponticola]|uniref:Outer membrane protein assembly factor BamE n=1 Tax=Aliishimia ponticola TaxID=2499833 RepID=A0A4S4NGJ3_9RHOB|nr:outer membrane protein assembly factor BamE [Aliishimia ponticola]THH38772.1 outer membrane protein assembly factor BamE [Aliishimia ponticola]